jgi:hypothetical protein
MPLLANAKSSVARQLDSHAGHSESRQNMLCAYLSAALLVGLTLNAALEEAETNQPTGRSAEANDETTGDPYRHDGSSGAAEIRSEGRRGGGSGRDETRRG